MSASKASDSVRGAFASAVGLLAAAHHQVFADADALGEHAQTVARNDAGADLGELAFAEVRILVEQILGEDELEDGVAEEFEPLIVEMMALRLVAEAGMGERFREQQRIAEFVFDALFERVHGGTAAHCAHSRQRRQMPSRAR